MEAAITYGNGFYKKKYKSLFADMTDSLEDEKKEAYRKVEVEAERLKVFSNFMEMFEYAATNYVQFEMFLSAMDKYCVYEYLPENRLKVIHLEDDMSLILKLSYFFDYAVQMKKKNKKQRIRIFTYPATLFQYDYLTGYCWLKQALHKGKSLTITLKSSRFKYPNESAPICSQISSFVCLEAIRR